MIKTRKHIILSAFSFIVISYLVSHSSSILCNDSTPITHQKFDVNLPSTENASYKKRMRKPSHKKEKIKRARTFLEFDYERLTAAKNVQVERGNITVAIKYLEQMMKLCTDITLLADHLLEIADLFFMDSQFQKSSLLYTQYCTLYPGNARQEYALYRSIISSSLCILSSDRDQTITESTLTLTEQYLEKDHFTSYKSEVSQVQMQCYEQLAENECSICTFYLHRGNLTAAEKRLKNIRSHWLPKLPTIEPIIITLEAALTEKKDGIKALQEEQILLTQNKKPQHMADRF